LLRVVIFMQERRKNFTSPYVCQTERQGEGKKGGETSAYFLSQSASCDAAISWVLFPLHTDALFHWRRLCCLSKLITTRSLNYFYNPEITGKKNKKIIFTHKLLVIFFLIILLNSNFGYIFNEYMWVSKVKKLIWAIVEVVDSTFCNHLCSSVCESWSSTSLSEKWVLDSYVILL